MNKIEQLLNEIDRSLNINLFNKIYDLKENEIISINTFEKVDLGINYFYLSTNKNKNYLYYKATGNNVLYYEALFDEEGKVEWSNSHSNMANSYGSDFGLKQYSQGIINEFISNGKNIKYEIETHCHHFDKEIVKHPISEKNCHIFNKLEYHKIRNLESKIRNNFNETEQNCKRCGVLTVLDDSHLVSAHNIRSLTDNNKNKAYYSAKFFDDLNKKPFTSLMTISDNFLNDQNRNCKIACFCKVCEKSFNKTDDNSFNDIKEIEVDMLYKSLGIYSQEAKYNIELIEKLEKEHESQNKQHLINSLTKQRSINEKAKIENLLIKLKANQLDYKVFNLEYELINNAFIETVSFSFDNDKFYLIYITNKEKTMYVNVITNDIKFPRDHRFLHNILYAAITINKYCFYSKDFYEDIKDVAYNMIYDFYNNDMEKMVFHPLDITKINYGVAIRNILGKYVDMTNYYSIKINSIYPDL